MQFRKAQRAELARNWEKSWFRLALPSNGQRLIEEAYGLVVVKEPVRNYAQFQLSDALSTFALDLGCDKSHVTHALLTGSVESLMRALGKIEGSVFSEPSIKLSWCNAITKTLKAELH